jgi:hypothetical protein
MRGAVPTLSQYVFMAWCLVKHRHNFTFYLYHVYLNVIVKSLVIKLLFSTLTVIKPFVDYVSTMALVD